MVGKQQIRQERENCCDDLAVSVRGDALTYSRALTQLEELRGAMPQLAMAANAGSLLARIKRLIEGRDQTPRLSSDWILVKRCGDQIHDYQERIRYHDP